ncbi:MAG TPA: glucose-1-phosphate adenylyltransferase family protein [Atribacteraceae bacterium]|nr:glucose-1-phosphate adenylyltransferase family protein [Atribacteraceae bacterium]
MAVRYALILAGGKEDRLSVLSLERAKAAVPYGSFYRLIDFALSNCVNSGIFDIGILTQYQPRSLIEHIGVGRPWDLDRKRGGVELLQPFLSRTARGWYRGTGDALFQNLNIIDRRDIENLLVLSGDHAYMMDYNPLMDFHRDRNADITLVVTRIKKEEGNRFGILEIDANGWVTGFEEKPENPRTDIAFMGVYIFRYDFLRRKLTENAREDKYDLVDHVIVESLGKASIQAYYYNDCWWDAGSLKAYWEANMHLLEPLPRFNLYNPHWVIFTNRPQYPPVFLADSTLVQSSIIGEGSVIRGEVRNSLIFSGVVVEKGARLINSIVFNDSIIKSGAYIEMSILDKNVVVGEGTVVGYGGDYRCNEVRPDLLNWGVNLIGKGTVLPAGFMIERNCLVGIGLLEKRFTGRSSLSSGSSFM